MERFPVVDVVEQAISNSVNAMVGNRDVNLNTIVKMAKLDEVKPIDENKKTEVIAAILNNNRIEQHFINLEYQLTMDNCGNLVYINEEKGEKDT